MGKDTYYVCYVKGYFFILKIFSNWICNALSRLCWVGRMRNIGGGRVGMRKKLVEKNKTLYNQCRRRFKSSLHWGFMGE